MTDLFLSATPPSICLHERDTPDVKPEPGQSGRRSGIIASTLAFGGQEINIQDWYGSSFIGEPNVNKTFCIFIAGLDTAYKVLFRSVHAARVRHQACNHTTNGRRVVS